MDATDTARTWRIGELAGMAHVSVRTLRHYDAIGLLRPAARTEAGYRLYTAADVTRLYRILALRSLGLPLDEIGRALDAETGLAEVLARQLDAVERRMAADGDLHRRLRALIETCAGAGAPTVAQLTDTMEAIRDVRPVLHAGAAGDARDAPRGAWPRRHARRRDGVGGLIAKADAERAAGTDPAAPRMQAIARRWRELIEQFTGGDPGIRESLGQMYREQGVEAASRGGVSSQLMAYVGQALTVRRE